MVHLFPSNLGFNAYIPVQGITVTKIQNYFIQLNETFLINFIEIIQKLDNLFNVPLNSYLQ